MKRKIALLAAAVLVVLSLAACKGGQGKGPKATPTPAVNWDEGDQVWSKPVEF